MKHDPRLSLMAVALSAAFAGGTSNVAGAAAFALIEQSASGMGNAYAGAAASAEDASTIFFNPAGMSLLPGLQIVIAGHAVNVNARFNDQGSTLPAAGPALPRGGNGGNAGDLAFIPNLYVAMPIGQRLAVGLGVNAPFGLATEYDDDWVGRFQGIKSELTTINVNPSVSFKVNDQISLGAGLNYQHVEVELTNAVMLGVNTEGRAKLEADDATWGWNLGALFQISPDMRIGVSYRSALDYELDGDVTVTNAAGVVVGAASGAAVAEVEFPDMASLSLVQKFGDKWELLGDFTYTWWSKIGSVNVINPAVPGSTRDVLAFNLDDSFRVALGLNYFHDEKWTFKGGVAYDQTPVSDEFRTVRLPDEDRWWIALGAKYRLSKAMALDIAYAHLFVDSPEINLTRSQIGVAGSASTVRGDYDSSVDILSLQLTYTFQ